MRPIELATAYCALANGGKRVEPHYIVRLDSQTMKQPEPRQVLRPEVAFVLTSMMQSVIQEGTARRAVRLSRPVAGKTGTTNDLKDAWFAGFTPQLVAVVWVGFDEPRPLGRHETGGQAARRSSHSGAWPTLSIPDGRQCSAFLPLRRVHGSCSH